MDTSTTKEKDQQMDNELFDPLFPEAALYAATRDDLSVGDLVGHFDLDEARARTIMDQMAAHGLLASTRRRYSGITVLVQDVEDMRSRLADIGVVVDEGDESPVDPGKEVPTTPDATEQAQPTTTDESADVPDARAEQETHETEGPKQAQESPNTGGANATRNGTGRPSAGKNKPKQKPQTQSDPDGGSPAPEPTPIWHDQQPERMTLPIDRIKAVPKIQCREHHCDLAVVSEYADQMHKGVQFPPVVVFQSGKTYWLADGFHRLAASKRVSAPTIAVQVYKGTPHDALLYAAGANAAHGLKRTNKDKRRAIDLVLKDMKWAKRSDNWIARMVHVDHKTVTNRREKLGIPKSEIRQSASGRTIDTTNIGKSPRDAHDIDETAAKAAGQAGNTVEGGDGAEPPLARGEAAPGGDLVKPDRPQAEPQVESPCVRPSKHTDPHGTWVDDLADLVVRATREKLDHFAFKDEKVRNELIERLDQQIRQLEALRDELKASVTSGRAAA